MAPRKLAKQIAFVTMALIALAGCERYALDRKMEELCKRDGGVQVYEIVHLSPEMFDAIGMPFPQQLRSSAGHRADADSAVVEELLGSAYQRTWEVVYIKRGDPVRGEGTLSRTSERITRLSDRKVIGEAVSYSRIGGDFVAFPHFSSSSCPVGVDNNTVTRAVFKPKKD